ncbi:MAG TPA: DUF4232 domain-containing protein [Trebonia sp.]|jgi:hypothetical protein|nr:DUF4232 domain-containing protein [Trebonia sp.]
MTRKIPPAVLPVIAATACALALAACASASSSTAGPSAPAGTSTVFTHPAPISTGPAGGGTSGTSPGAAGPGGAVAVAACRGSQVATTLTHTGAATGAAGGFLTFTNRGNAPCTLSGWPAVTAITAAGARTPVPHATAAMIGHWRYAAPAPVTTLAPGAAAYAAVQGANVAVGRAGRCPPPYTRLQVAIPGATAPVTLSAWLPGAAAYLPSCPAATGGPAIAESDINPPAILPR